MERELVDKMVKAMELQTGEVVLLNFWGDETELSDLYDFVGAVTAVGAMPMTLLHTNQYERALLENMEGEVPEKWLEQFAAADVVIDIMEKPAGRLLGDFRKRNIQCTKSICKNYLGRLVRRKK